MHALENDRKAWLGIARTAIEYSRKKQKNLTLENAHLEKCKKINYTPWKIAEKSHP